MKKFIFPAMAIFALAACQKEDNLTGVNKGDKSMRSKEQMANPGGVCNSCEAYHPVNDNGRWVDVNLNGHKYKAFEVDNKYVIEGDILLKQPEASINSTVTTLSSKLWPNKTMYYRWAANLPKAQKDIFNAAINEWNQQVPGIKIVYSNTASDYVEVNKGIGCSSYIGVSGGKQILNIGEGCYSGQAIHEIGHALGLFHEQTRPDRDNYVIIKTENIQDGKAFNFEACRDCEGLGSFDFGSIMLYGSDFFSKNGEPTITKIDGSTYEANREHLSQNDIDGIKQLYALN